MVASRIAELCRLDSVARSPPELDVTENALDAHDDEKFRNLGHNPLRVE
jgi:hypothetical protein